MPEETETKDYLEALYDSIIRPVSLRASYSKLDTYRTCPRKYKYIYMDRLHEPPSEAMLIGSAVHSALETWLAVEGKDVGDLIDIFAAACEAGREEGPISDEEEELARAMLFDYYGQLQTIDKDLVVGIEHNFELIIPGTRITGIIDRAMYLDGSKETLIVADYKGLALDTKLPTPTGWTTISEVRVGDKIIGGDGRSCSVLNKSDVHHNPCYRITFDDNTSIVCDHEHKWVVDTPRYGQKILTTEELKNNLFSTGKNPQRHLTIPTVVPILEEKELPIDPYVLGTWFGDGHNSNGEICKSLEANLLKNKHIPLEYMRASYNQRLDLLRGIMDTDGHWNPLRKRCVVTTTNKQYAYDINQLVVSLGWKATTFHNKGKGFGKTVDVWQTWFTPVDEEVFITRLPKTYRKEAPTQSRRRLIVSVELIEMVPTQCLVVDSPDHTFLCGEQMVKTHNSGRSSITQAKAKNNWQMGIYTMAARKLWPAKRYITELIYPRLNKTVRHEFTPEELDKIKKELIETSTNIKLDTRFAPAGVPPICGNCGYKTDCGWGKVQARIWAGIQAKRGKK